MVPLRTVRRLHVILAFFGMCATNVGKAKYILDDIALRVEERLGYTVQTKTSNGSAVRIDGDRGFKLDKL